MPAYGLPPEGLEVYVPAAKAFVEAKYEGRNRRIRDVLEHRTRRKEPKVPKSYKKSAFDFRSTTTKDVLRRGQAILYTGEPMPKRRPLKLGVRAEASAEDIVRWLKQASIEMDRGRPVWGQITDALPADGMAVWKISVDVDSYFPERGEGESSRSYNRRRGEARRASFPFSREHIPSASYYPLAYDKAGVSEVMEITYREAFPLLTQYSLVRENGKLRKASLGEVRSDYPSIAPRDTVAYTEWWNRTHWACFIEDVLVDSGEHGGGRPPYFCAFFSPTSIHDPEFETEGLADTIIPLQDLEDTFVTTMMSWLIRHGFPALTLRPNTPDAPPVRQREAALRVVANEVSVPPDGYELQWFTPPPISGDITRLLDYIVDRMNDVSLAKVLYGETEDTSGPAAAAVIALAKAIFGPAAKSLAQALDEQASYILRYIDLVIEDEVPLFVDTSPEAGEWLAIGPSDINGYYLVTHSLEPIIPMEQMQKAIFWANAMQLGGVDMTHYRVEGLGLDDPSEMDRRIRIEEYRKQPEYRAMLLEEFQTRIRRKRGVQASAGTPATQPEGFAGPGAVEPAGINQSMLPGMEGVAPGSPQPIPAPPTVGLTPPGGGGMGGMNAR